MTRSGHCLHFLSTLIAFVLAQPAWGGTLELLADGRSLFATGLDDNFQFVSESAQPPAPFADWDEGITAGTGGNTARASQRSSFASQQLNGNGGVSLSNEAGPTRSTYSILFRLDEAAAYDFSGELFDGQGIAPAGVELRSGSNVIFSAVSAGGPQETTFSDQGVLQAGDYELLVEIDTQGPQGGDAGDSAWSFVFVIPEPSTAALLGAALAALAALRPRSRN